MIRGGFNDRRPHISGLLLFPGIGPGHVSCRFLVDTGADRTLVAPASYQLDGFAYRDFRAYPAADSVGYGGSIEGRLVPAKLLLPHDDGRYEQVAVEVEIAKPAPAVEHLPSILGRDVTDLFRLVVDRSVNLVCLDTPAAAVHGAWPDEEE